MIESHQQLLEKYYKAMKSSIGEYSSDFRSDTLELIGEVREYADKVDLDSRFSNEDYAHYTGMIE